MASYHRKTSTLSNKRLREIVYQLENKLEYKQRLLAEAKSLLADAKVTERLNARAEQLAHEQVEHWQDLARGKERQNQLLRKTIRSQHRRIEQLEDELYEFKRQDNVA